MLKLFVFALCVALVGAFQMSTSMRTSSFVSSQKFPKSDLSMSLRKPANVAFMKLPDVNTPAPSFKLPDSTGKLVGLDNFKGKWTVLYFCKFCCSVHIDIQVNF